MEDLRDELDLERRRRREAGEEMIHFLNIECQFQRCSCRIAESEGRQATSTTGITDDRLQEAPEIEAAEAAHAEAAGVRGCEDCAGRGCFRVETIEAAQSQADQLRLKAAEAARAEVAGIQAAEAAQVEKTEFLLLLRLLRLKLRVLKLLPLPRRKRLELRPPRKQRPGRSARPLLSETTLSLASIRLSLPQPPAHEERSRTPLAEPPTPPVHQHFEPAVKG